jgi:hypothetical protein
MVANILGWLVLLLIALLFGWLTWRAWRIRRAILKWPAVGLAGLLTLLLVVITGVTGAGWRSFTARRRTRRRPICTWPARQNNWPAASTWLSHCARDAIPQPANCPWAAV